MKTASGQIRMRSWLLVVLPAMLVLLWAGSAIAGKITGLEVSPNPVEVTKHVKFTIQGKGTCSKMEMTFGDGQTETINNLTFSTPLILTYQYASTGTHDVKIKQNSSDCSGKATATVTVEEAGGDTPGLMVEKLCAIVDCIPSPGKIDTPLVYLDKKISPVLPVLEGVLHIPPKGATMQLGPDYPLAAELITAGGVLHLGGKNFGPAPGKVILNGVPGNSPIELEILKWDEAPSMMYEDTASARIPTSLASLLTAFTETITGFSVTLQVARAGSSGEDVLSNKIQKIFIVPHDIVLLKQDDPALKVSSCSEFANENWCNSIHTSSICSSFDGFIANTPGSWGSAWQPHEVTIAGGHANCAGAIGDDKAGDQYSINLKNGWAIYDVVGVAAGSSNGEKVSTYPADPSELIGKPEASFRVDSEVTPGDAAIYRYKIWIVGPANSHNWW
jgi:hypothetical protein